MQFLKNKKITTTELFLLAYCTYILYMIHDRSGYVYLSYGRYIYLGLKYLCFVLLLFVAFLKFSTRFKMTWRNLILGLVFMGLVFIGWFNANYTTLLFAALFMLLGVDVSFEKIIKTLQITIVIGLSVVFIGCLLGIIPNNQYYHSTTGVTAYTLGFNYYSYPQSLITTFLMCYLYNRRNNLKVRNIIIVLFVGYISYRIFSTRLFMIEIIFICTLYWIVFKTKIVSFRHKIWRYISNCSFAVCCIAIYIVSDNYSTGNSTMIILDTFLSGRLRYNYSGLNLYGIGLLPQYVEMTGNVEQTLNGASRTLYIDSGYMYSLIAYGLLFTILLLVMYTMLFRSAYKTGNKALYIWCLALAFLNISNNFMVSVVTNPLVFLAAKTLLKKQNDADTEYLISEKILIRH